MITIMCSRLCATAAAAALAIPLALPVHAAETCSRSAADVFAATPRSVAQILVMAIDPFDPYRKVRYATGTGFVVDDSGLMLTNYHVLLNAASIHVSFRDGGAYRARFVAGDPILDIAELRPDMPEGEAKPLPMAADAMPAVGTPVFAIGHPLGLKTSISTGIVSSTDVVLPITTMSWDEPYIQTDAAINPGNSGGPLLDGCGRVVGMNTLGFPEAENIGFAIPASTLKSAMAALAKDGRIRRPWIGITGRMADPFVQDLARMPFESGFMIETVEPGSAADKAGLHGGYLPLRLGLTSYLLGGDIIKSVNGREVTDLAATAAIVRSLKPGDHITVEYYRDGEVATLETTLPERPQLAEDIRVLYRSVYAEPDAEMGR